LEGNFLYTSYLNRFTLIDYARFKGNSSHVLQDKAVARLVRCLFGFCEPLIALCVQESFA